MKKRTLLFITFLCCQSLLFAQQGPSQGPPTGRSGNAKMPSIGHIYGKVVDAKTKDAVPFVSVAVYKRDSLVGGCLAGNNGEFNLENLPFGRLNLKITFIGFKTFQQQLTITPQTLEQDLGNIKLETEETLLKAVDVVGEKSTTQMNIDRKVFNVDKDLTVKGGTATDVMKNIPSVTIDGDGNAQLRQNSVTIYVDGRPTTLTLDQIPADQIEKVEVITNPSAKFEASTTGGIINIVMKTNTKPGYNGMITGGIGTNDHYNGMVALNFKQRPIGISVNYNYNSFNNPITGYSNRTQLLNGNPLGYYKTTTNSSFKNTMQGGMVSFDYFINNRNTITLGQNMFFGDFDNYNYQDFRSEVGDHVLSSYGTRSTPALNHFEHYTSTAHYKKTFPKKGEELVADAAYNTTNGHSISNYETRTYDQSGILNPNNPELLDTRTHNTNEMYTISADYTNPINDSTKLELGIRSNYKPSTQSMDVSQYDYTTGTYRNDPYLTNHYKIQDFVNAAYITYSARFKGLSYSAGLRFEDSYYKGILTDRHDSSFLYHYPSGLNNLMNALFPSLYISKKINDKQEWQLNVSRKINRPNFRQIMPFIMAIDPKNYMIGNPQLTPEFITMAELNFNQLLGKGNLFFTLFYRNTQNPLTSYNTPYAPNSDILLNTFINGKQSNTVGMDNTFKYTLVKGLEGTLNMNLFYTVIQANYNNINTSNKGFNYNTKLNLQYRLPKGFALQLSGNYESPKVLPQGKSKEFYFADCGLSKDLYKFLTLTLSVSDIFDTKGRGMLYITDQYTQDSWGRRESRYIKFTARIRFGKADATLFKKRQPNQQQDDQEGGFF
jgi:iron complex outermembrane receptor protein